MLKYYEISNFKSFKNTTRFDLEKTNYKILSQSNTVGNVLKGIMFVGANASGKSNSILAIKFLLDCLFGKIDINMGRYICLFSNHPIMTLKYAFDIDGSEIIYTITFQRFDKKINEELILDGKRILYRDGSVATVNISDESVYTEIPDNILFLPNWQLKHF